MSVVVSFIKSEYPVTKMLDKLILCVFEAFKDTLQIGLLFKWFYCLRKTLITMKSIVEVRETLTLCVRVKSITHYIFAINGWNCFQEVVRIRSEVTVTLFSSTYGIYNQYLFILPWSEEINRPWRKENDQWKAAWLPVTSERVAMLMLAQYR